MIYLGLDNAEKRAAISAYVSENAIRNTVVFSPQRFFVELGDRASSEQVEYAEIIMYRTYYRLLRDVGPDTLLVLNECLRTQNRHDLTYNCLRNFLQQTAHQLVFQYLPAIGSTVDFMVLVDLVTRSRFRAQQWDSTMRDVVKISGTRRAPTLHEHSVEVSGKVRDTYARKKRELIDTIGQRDPHTIPRNLLLVSGKPKLAAVDPDARYVGRNNRFKLDNLQPYKSVSETGQRHVFELCHGYRDFADFLCSSRQTRVEVLTTDLPVDCWYFERFAAWSQMQEDTYAEVLG